MLIFVVSLVQRLGITIDNWCHVNVKTSWFKKSLSSSHPLIARPRSIQSIAVCACHMKHSNTVIAHSNMGCALFWWSRLMFCLCYQFIAKVTSLWSVHTRHNKKLCLASQNKKKVHLDFSTAPEHIRGQMMKDWRFARFLFVSSWFGACFQFSSRNLENLWCYLFHPLSFQRHYKYSINWIIHFKLSFQSELFSTTELLICTSNPSF